MGEREEDWDETKLLDRVEMAALVRMGGRLRGPCEGGVRVGIKFEVKFKIGDESQG